MPKKKRLFSPSTIGPIWSAIVVWCFIGYVIFSWIVSEGDGLFTHFKEISFEVYIICQAGIAAITLYNKKLFDDFLEKYPVINNELAVRELKPILRMNMYSTLLFLFLLGLGILTAVISVLNHGLVVIVIIGLLFILPFGLAKWYAHSEEKIKQIECTNSTLDSKLRNIIECWMNKALPNF